MRTCSKFQIFENKRKHFCHFRHIFERAIGLSDIESPSSLRFACSFLWQSPWIRAPDWLFGQGNKKEWEGIRSFRCWFPRCRPRTGGGGQGQAGQGACGHRALRADSGRQREAWRAPPLSSSTPCSPLLLVAIVVLNKVATPDAIFSHGALVPFVFRPLDLKASSN